MAEKERTEKRKVRVKKVICVEKKAASRQEIAAMYGIAAGTLANLASQKKGPRYSTVGRKPIYFIEDVEAWVRVNPVLTITIMNIDGRK